LVQEYGEDAVLTAIREAVTHNARKLAYIEAVLRRIGGKAKPQEARLRAVKLRWLRARGVSIADDANDRDLDAAVMEVVGYDPRYVPDWSQMQSAASR
jgi:hypothetical protein